MEIYSSNQNRAEFLARKLQVRARIRTREANLSNAQLAWYVRMVPMNREQVRESPWLGVLGGMGPMAGAAFMARLVSLTEAERDQDHIPAVLCNDPRVPDRSAARLGMGADPLQQMLAGIHLLERAGVQLIAIPCNTAHLWFDQIHASASVPVLHIIESACDDLKRQGIARGKVGLMGTAATLKLRLYQEPLEARGYSVILPTQDETISLSVAAIELVKANRTEEAFEPAAECIRRLVGRGADAVVLGCTELPLSIPHNRRGEFGTVLTDSIDALAKAVIERWTRR